MGTKTKAPTDQDYIKVGKTIEGLLVQDYLDLVRNPLKMVWLSFVRGLFTGLGTVIGATVMIALLLYFLKLFGGIPVVGEYFREIYQIIEQR